MTDTEINRRLEMALGKKANTLTDSERRVASRVIRWAFDCCGATISVPDDVKQAKRGRARRLAAALKAVIPIYSGVSWAAVMSKSRDRSVSEMRYIAFHILWSESGVAKATVSDYLGVNRDHSTVLYGINQCDNWRQYDADFSNDYETVKRLVEIYLEDDDIEKVYQELNK